MAPDGSGTGMAGLRAAYGQVLSVCADPRPGQEGESGSLVRLRVLYGCPTLSPGPAHILEAGEIARVVQELQGPVEHPLALDAVGPTDFFRLGALTVIQGNDFAHKHEALMLLVRAIEPYQHVLILDPLGLSAPGDGVARLQAGDDRRLSLQRLGSKRFLDAFAELLPVALREAGLRTVANLLPPSPDTFLGFQALLALEALAEAPLRNLILQNLHALARARVFADTPDEAFTPENALPKPVSILDLSPLPEPWKSLFYAEACREILQNAEGDIALALIHPEHYWPDLSAWVRQADESESNLLVLASPDPKARSQGRRYSPRKNGREKENRINGWQELANNRLWVDSHGRATLQGELTLGLPVPFALSSSEADSSPAQPDAMQLPLLSAPSPPFREEPDSDLISPTASDSPEASPATGPEVLPESPPIAEMALIAPDEPEIGSAEETPVSSDEPEAPSLEPSPVPLPEAIIRQPAEEPEVSTETPQEAVSSPEDEEIVSWMPVFEDNPLLASDTPEPVVEAIDSAPAEIPAESGDDEPFFFDPGLLGELEAFSIHADDDDIAAGSIALPPSEGASATAAFPYPEMPGHPVEPEDIALDALLETARSKGPETEALEPAESQDTQEETPVPDAGSEAETPAPEMPVPPPPFVDEPPPIHHRESDKPGTALPHTDYRVGERVRHPGYGTGVIRKILPMDNQVILNVTFERVGKRLLDPSLCTLIREPDQGH
jgi:hypothetical protein